MNSQQKAKFKNMGIILLSALAFSACGGGGGGDDGGTGGGSSGGAGDGGITVGGAPGDNACVDSAGIADMKCYMVPGDTGDTPSVSETVYQWNSTSSKFVSQGTRTRAFDIKANSADITSTGALSAGDPVSYSWTSSNFTVTNPDGSIAKFSRYIQTGGKSGESIIETSGTTTVTAYVEVFGPQTYTLTIPGTNDTLTANNAILRVMQVPSAANIAHISVLIPEQGAVAAIDYINCGAVGTGNLQFKNDISYYETTCGHGHFMKADEAALRIANPSGSTTPGGGTTPTDSDIENYIRSKLGSGSETVKVKISTNLPGELPTVYFNKTLKNVGVPNDQAQFCGDFADYSMHIYDPGHTPQPDDACLFMETPLINGVITTFSGTGKGGQASYVWE